MNSIRPIETEYRDYLFRSRLEARWAVFLDTLGVPYEYEPEGYDLGDGMLYLPDFWLPTWDAWLEIKPNMNACNAERAMNLMRRLALETGKLGLLFVGDVWPGKTEILLAQPAGYWTSQSYARISQCSLCDGLCLEQFSWDGIDGPDDLGFRRIGPHTCEHSDVWPTRSAPTVVAAYRSARQARFESRARVTADRRQMSG